MSKETAIKKPVSLQLIGPAFPVWNEMAVHLRDGFVINPNLGIEVASNGNAIVNLVLGNPDTTAIERAKESTELAIHLEQAQYERDVKAAAAAMLEVQRRQELEKQVAKAVADHEKQIAALKQAAQAEIAQLEKASAAEIAKLK